MRRSANLVNDVDYCRSSSVRFDQPLNQTDCTVTTAKIPAAAAADVTEQETV